MSLLAAVAPVIGVPYRLHGASPETGWDCIGCARYVRETIAKLPWHSDGIEYSTIDAIRPELRAGLIEARLSEWTRLGSTMADVREGAVLLFKLFGSVSHVGVAVSETQFIHCTGGVETSLVDLTLDAAWERRLRGVYD